jgi:hypothetical protein
MFVSAKEMEKLDIPVDRIVWLLSAMNEVQVALPGLPGQRSAAHFCVYSVSKGCEAVVGLVLFEAGKLAFYRYNKVFPAARMEEVIQQGILFVESMGFMLNDLDFGNLSAEERERIWGSCPLSKGSTAIPRPADPPAVTQEPVPPPAVEEMIPPKLPMAGSGEQGEVRSYEKRFELCRRMGRFLASF